jgi:hypothetical protein
VPSRRSERRPSAKTSDQRRGQTRVERVLNKQKPSDLRWWREDDPHEAVFAQIQRIGRSSSARQRNAIYYACLYDDTELAALIQGSQAMSEFTPQTMVTNIIKRQSDAFVAQISKNRPVPMAMTNDGTWGEQRRAKSLSKFFDGILDQVGYWDTRPLLLRDGAIFGTGLAHNYRVGSKLVHERIFPWEVWIDPREAQYGKPRSLYIIRYVDRLLLMERYPGKEEEILGASGDRVDHVTWDIGWDETSDLVLVVEAWHLPNADPTDKDAKCGSHVICCDNVTLEHADYKRDYFPLSRFNFNPGLVGWWGDGLAKQLEGLQFEVNSIGLRMQEQGWMTGTYVWPGPNEGGVEVEKVDNGALTVIEGSVKPEFFSPPAWHPQLFDYYLFLRGRAAAEETRLSEMATRGEKPPGLDSGKAIRAWRAMDSEAFGPQQTEDERNTIDTSWQLFDLCEEIHDDDEEEPLIVAVENREYGESVVEEFDFAKVRMDRKKFKLRVWPTSLLQGTPAEKYQTVKEMMADGLFSQDELYALLDIPDVQRVLNLRGAARRAIEKILEAILDADDPEGAYVPPEPAMNLELCRALGLMTFLDAYVRGAPDENLFWVLQFSIDAEQQLEDMEEGLTDPGVDPAQMDAAAAAGELPPGGGDPSLYAPPQGQLLPAGAVPPQGIAPTPAM